MFQAVQEMKDEAGEVEGDGIPVIVKTLTGKTMNLSLKPNDTARDIKKSIEKSEGTPVTSQRLIYKC